MDDLYQNASFDRSESVLIRLHEEMMDGAESSEADRLRDGLDALDRDLTQFQRDYLRGLSGDLYQLEDDEVFLRVSPEERLGDRFESAVQRSLIREDYRELLRLIRTEESPYADEQRAYLRGLGYAGLDRHAAAFLFMRRAARSGKLVHQYLALDYLVRSDAKEAAAVGWRIIDSEEAEDALRVQAAWAVIVPTREMPDEDARELWARIARYLPPYLSGESARRLPRPVLALGLLTAALCHELLGNVRDAIRYYIEGFFADPGNSSVVDALRAHLSESQLRSIIDSVAPVVDRSGLEFVERENAEIFAVAA